MSPVDSTEIIVWKNINIGGDRLKQINSSNKTESNIRRNNTYWTILGIFLLPFGCVDRRKWPNRGLA